MSQKITIYTEELIIPTSKELDENALQYLIDDAGLNVKIIVRKNSVRCLAPTRQEMISLHAIIDTLNQ